MGERLQGTADRSRVVLRRSALSGAIHAPLSCSRHRRRRYDRAIGEDRRNVSPRANGNDGDVSRPSRIVAVKMRVAAIRVARASRALVSASRRNDLLQSPRWRDAIANARDARATQAAILASLAVLVVAAYFALRLIP